MSDVSIAGIREALSQNSRRTTIGDWIVASNSTARTIYVTKSDNTAVNLSNNVINDLTNSMISFEAPGVNEGVYRHITNVSTSGTLTLDSALPNTPNVGDPFTILAQMQVDVTTSENVSQWGGAAVEAADANGVPKQQQAYTEGVAGSAVPTHTLQVGGTDGTDLRALSTDGSGRLNANLSQAQGAAGSAVPNQAIQVGGTDGTDLRALAITTGGRLTLSANVVSISNVSESASTAFGSFTAPHTGTAKILAGASAAANLSLTANGQTNELGSLGATTWATFSVPVVSGGSYSFQVSAAVDVSLIVNVSTD